MSDLSSFRGLLPGPTVGFIPLPPKSITTYHSVQNIWIHQCIFSFHLILSLYYANTLSVSWEHKTICGKSSNKLLHWSFPVFLDHLYFCWLSPCDSSLSSRMTISMQLLGRRVLLYWVHDRRFQRLFESTSSLDIKISSPFQWIFIVHTRNYQFCPRSWNNSPQ